MRPREEDLEEKLYALRSSKCEGADELNTSSSSAVMQICQPSVFKQRVKTWHEAKDKVEDFIKETDPEEAYIQARKDLEAWVLLLSAKIRGNEHVDVKETRGDAVKKAYNDAVENLEAYKALKKDENKILEGIENDLAMAGYYIMIQWAKSKGSSAGEKLYSQALAADKKIRSRAKAAQREINLRAMVAHKRIGSRARRIGSRARAVANRAMSRARRFRGNMKRKKSSSRSM